MVIAMVAIMMVANAVPRHILTIYHREAWRYEGHFTKANMYRNLWPGFTYGVGAFVLYCIGEKALGGKSHSEHGAEHSEH